jgi:hypothetical protein
LSLTVKAASPESERNRLMPVLRREFPDWGGEDKFEWLYLRNPLGRARVWTLEDEEGEIVGVSSAFPRRLHLGNRQIDAWVLGDFCVAKAHRSLGPAITLQRAALDAVERGEVGAFYDFPSRTMIGVYRRMGVSTRGDLVRLVRPLRVDRTMDERIPSRVLARGMSLLGNAALGSRDRLEIGAASEKVVRWTGPIDRAFEGMESLPRGVAVVRSSDYLRWRYQEDPRGPAAVLVAGGEGPLSSCVVYRSAADKVAIVDCFGDMSALPGLMSPVVEEARAGSAESISVALSSEHPWLDAFQKIHFHRRESAAFFVHAGPGVLDPEAPWFLTDGDRDL